MDYTRTLIYVTSITIKLNFTINLCQDKEVLWVITFLIYLRIYQIQRVFNSDSDMIVIDRMVIYLFGSKKNKKIIELLYFVLVILMSFIKHTMTS